VRHLPTNPYGYGYTNLARWQPAQRHNNPHSGTTLLPAVAILQDSGYVLRHTCPHSGYVYTNLARWQPAQSHTNPHSGTTPLPAVAILQDSGYDLRHTSPHSGTLGAVFCKMADSAYIYS